MFSPCLDLLNGYSIVLASQSPRRISLLQELGLKFRAEASNFAENLPHSSYLPLDYCMETCKRKAFHSLTCSALPDLLISSDTIVTINNEILEKPANESEALIMLRKLSGQTHQVITCVTLLLQTALSQEAKLPESLTKEEEIVNESLINLYPNLLNYRVFSFSSHTFVTFSSLSDEQLLAYIKTGEPFDKAGGYGIQNTYGAQFIDKIDGDYYTVVGLPVNKLCTRLMEIAKVIKQKKENQVQN
jgi:septum formation protein